MALPSAADDNGDVSPGRSRRKKGWDTDGVEGEDRFVTLLYNEPADALIAQFERMIGGRYPVRSLYMKRRGERRYTRVFGADDRTGAPYVVVATKKPMAFFYVHIASVDRWPADTPGMGFDWSHIARIDLRTGSVTQVADAESFRQKYDGWVSDILSADEHGRTLLCRVGMPRKLPSGRPSRRIGYSLCRLNLATNEIEVVAPLPHVFF
jgi:hypothetical protein